MSTAVKESIRRFDERPSGRRVLNAGSGPAAPDKLHPVFQGGGWSETRLDLNPDVQPDLVGSVFDLQRLVSPHSFDAIWSSHHLEHLYPTEVVPSLQEFQRALKPDGFALVTCPDLEAVSRLILERGLDETVYTSAAGPITPLDMIYGHVRSVAGGNKFMRHHCGFTAKTLGSVGLRAGFSESRVVADNDYALWAIFLMPKTPLDALAAMFAATPQTYLFEA